MIQTIPQKIQSFSSLSHKVESISTGSTRKSFSWDAFTTVQPEINVVVIAALQSLLSLLQIGLTNRVDGYGRHDFTCPNGPLCSPTILHDFPKNGEKEFYRLWSGPVNLSLHGQLALVKAPVTMQVTSET